MINQVMDNHTGNEAKTLAKYGVKELKRLETQYLPTITAGWRKRYDNYTIEEKLNYLQEKKKREDRKQLGKENKSTRMSIEQYLLTHPDIDWLEMDLNKLNNLEDLFNKYLEDIKTAEELLLSEQIEKEIATLREQNTEILSKIDELERTKANLFGDAA